MHRQKLEVDRALTERKIIADMALAERKFELDRNLAERKFIFDKGAVAWRRRFELAEKVLSSAYKVQDALLLARGRVIWEGEGETRPSTEVESPELKKARNSGFVPIERLASRAEAFASLQATQDSVTAHFGRAAVTAITTLLGEHRKISTAVSYLIRHAVLDTDRSGSDLLKPFRDELWNSDPVGGAQDRIAAAVKKLEEICRPVLQTAI